MAAALLMLIPAAAAAEDMEAQIEQVITSIDFSLAEALTVEIPGEEEARGVRETVELIAEGHLVFPEDIVAALIQRFVAQFSRLGTLALSIVLPVLLSSLIVQMSPNGEGVETLGRNVCFILVLIPIVLCVVEELGHVRESITITTERMDSMLPLLLTLLTAVGGSASSAFLHPVVVAASGSMVYLAREVILRLVMCTCCVTTINHLTEKAHLTRMARLLRSAVCWLLGVSFTVFLGAMSIQGTVTASVDGVAIRAAKYAVDNFVPVVGGMFSDTMDTLVGCTLIVKNALGVTSVLVLVGAIAAPMIRTFASAAILKLCAALLEPIAHSDTIQAIGDFANTIVLFLITMLCVSTMYFLLIVQMMLVGNLTVMLR